MKGELLEFFVLRLFLEKGLDFALVQRTLNEPELRKYFEEFYRRMRYKWHFRNEVSETFIEIPAFRPKSS